MTLTVNKTRFIPFNRQDIVRMLLSESGLKVREKTQFQTISHLLISLYHIEFHQSLETLKSCYAPVNPDADTQTVFETSDAAKADKEQQLFAQLDDLLNKANFEAITRDDLKRAMEEKSVFQIKLTADFDDFDEVLFFRRGESRRQETIHTLFGLRKKNIAFINYDRVVVIVKFKPQAYFAAQEREDLPFQPSSTIVKYFRNVPRSDLEMLFPNTEVRMRPIDKLMIGVPAAVGGTIMLVTKLGTTLLLSGALIMFWLGLRDESVALNQTNLLALAAGFGTLGAFLWKQFSNFKNRKIRFMKNLADNLYFKNLDNNMGVFHRLVDAAEESESKEALLAYYFLLMADTPLSLVNLDQIIENWFEEKHGHALDFEVDDALQKLLKLGLATENDGSYEAVSLANAKKILDKAWRQSIKVA